MTAVPRGVISIQSPWRQTPGIGGEVALAVAAAVVVAPEVDRHRGHRLGHDELADLVQERLALLVERLDRGAERARLQLPLVDRKRRHAADEGGADVGAAAHREEPGVAADLVVDPAEALGRERRARRADAAHGREVAAARGSTPAFMQAAMYAALVPKHVMPAAAARVPQGVQVGLGGAAVVEHDRGLGEQAADEEVPHHPAGRREPEEAVAALRVEVQVQLLQVLEQDPALAVDDRLRQAGRPGRVEHPERVVERQLRELEVGRGGGSQSPPSR